MTGCAKTNERDVFRFEAHQLELGLNESIELKLIMGSISEDEEIEYTLSEEGIITLEDNIATGINIGLVKVTAKVKNNPTTKATVEITVKDEKLSALKINGDSSVEVTGSLTLSVETIPSNISNEVVWSSNNEEIAKVDQNGKVTTYKPGKVSIKATSKYDPTLSALKEIDVLYKAGEELLLSFTKGDENVVLGTTSVLEAKVLPELANQTVVWTSSNEAIAKVVDGVITPVKVTAEEETVEIPSVHIATSNDGTDYYTIATINIPKINVNYPILSETTTELLKISPCKFWGADPNQVGNFCIVGHNYRNSLFFSKVPTLEYGDIIEITDLSGKTVQYSVYNKYIVNPDDTTCTTQLTNGRTEITLITCTNDSKQRYVIKANAI